MKPQMKMLLSGAAVAAALAGSASAWSATIIVPITGGPFSNANQAGVIPETTLNEGNDYDFTFSAVEPLSSATFSLYLQAQGPAQAQLIQYQFYSGSPDGDHTLIGQSTRNYNPELSFQPTAGDYYIEVLSSQIAKDGEVASGALGKVDPVPEPVSWVTMLLGMGALGLALRRRACRVALARVRA